jgi:sugar phosphate isomerase/epimerase
MRIGIFAKTFEGSDAPTVLAAARAAGYETVQFNMACLGLPPMPDAIPPGAAAGVARAARETGVSIAAVSGTYNMIHPDKAVRDAGLRRLDVLAASCAAMGAALVTLCTGTRDPHDQWRGHPGNATPEAWRDLLAEMEKAVAIAERHGVDLGVEPELANVVDGAAKARALLDAIASHRLRIVLDPANLFEVAGEAERRRLVEEAVDRLGDAIAMAHAKDRTPDGGFATAGKGVVDFRHFVGRLRSAGFDGPLVTHGLSAGEAPETAAFLAAILAEAGAA